MADGKGEVLYGLRKRGRIEKVVVVAMLVLGGRSVVGEKEGLEGGIRVKMGLGSVGLESSTGIGLVEAAVAMVLRNG